MTDGETTQKRGWFPYPGIYARITGVFLLVIIVIAGIGVFTVTRLVAGSIQERFNNQLVDSAFAASNSIVDIERQLLATLRLMVFTEGVPEAVIGGDRDSLDLWLRPIAANARLDDVIVFDRRGQGIIRFTRRPTEVGIEYDTPTPPYVGDWNSVARILNASVDAVGDKYADVVGDSPNRLVHISAPIVDEVDGTVIGGVSVGLTTEHLAQRVSEQSLSAVTLYRRDGIVLGSTFRTGLDDLALTPDKAAGLMAAVTNSTPIEDIALEGAPYQVLYAPFQLRSEPIGLLAVALPSNFIVERSSTSRDIFSVLFSILFVVVGVLGLMIARSITGPVRRLVDTTRAIRAGDFSRRVGLRTPDELGELGVSFDHMTDQLVQRSEEVRMLYLQQLQETAQRDAVLTSISDAVIVQDPHGRVILMNRTAQALVEVVTPDPSLRYEFVQLMQRPEELAEPKTVNLAEHFFSVLATPVYMPTRELLGYVVVFRDITAIVESERLKDELILQMSHELRTPLSAARGYIDLIKMFDQQHLSDKSSAYLEKATESMSTLERMVNQVVEVSAIVANRLTLDIDTVNLAQLLSDQTAFWKPVAQARGLTLSLFLNTSPLWIQADPERLSQVVDHLLRNAYSYTLPGGFIEVQAGVNGRKAIITVLDRGVGIAPDEIDRVFERMYRGRSAEAGPTDSRGLGLGLYISKQIVEAHHGTIRLESELNLGTIVTVELPVRQGGQP